jgi:hypothetical protein
MKQTSSRAVGDGLKHIQETYGFLLERGYEVFSGQEADLGWQVVLRRAGLFVSVLHTRGEDYVSFRAGTQPQSEFSDIGSVVYAATGERISLYGSDAQKLKQYLDQIEIYFATEYISDPDGLRSAQQAYREPIFKVEPGIPEEPKRIPFLYYPLLAVVLLLLFGALTTLYMVLLDRLFSAFALSPDTSDMVMGVGAVLLAIATMLLLGSFSRSGKKVRYTRSPARGPHRTRQ